VSTSPEPEVISLTAACEPTAHPLRVACEVSISHSAPLTFSFGVETADRTLSFEADTHHVFTVTGLTADTDYLFTASTSGATASGDFRTGLLPDLPAIEVEGEASFDYVLFSHDDQVIVATTQGEIVWYEVFEGEAATPQKGRVSGTAWAGDAIGVAIGSSLYEVALDGTVRFASYRGLGHDLPLHHDVFIRDGLRYAVNAQLHTFDGHDFVIDGFYVFDDSGIIGTWNLADHLDSDPVWTGQKLRFWSDEWPGAEDFAHANAIYATEDGTLLFSARRLNRVYAISGFHQPDFGDILWVLDGQTGADFEITGSPDGKNDFDGQHHPQLVGETLTLFDNRIGLNARTVAMTLDIPAGSATITEVHSLHRRCSIQGSTYVLANANVVATCGSSKEIFELEAGVDEDPLWTLTIDSAGVVLPRGIPIEDNPPGW